MNMLSILLYLIYFLKAASFFLGVAAAIMSIVLLVCFIVWGINSADSHSYYHGQAATKRMEWWAPRVKKNIKWPIILWALFFLIPNQQTVKLIAASEVAGYLASTEAGQQAISEMGKAAGKTGEIAQDSLNLLHEYIKQELSILQKEAETQVKEKVKEKLKELDL